MIERIQFQAKPAQKSSSIAWARSSLLQRRCACGGTSGVDGVCVDCRKKRLVGLQRDPGGRSGPSEAPPSVHEVLDSPGQALDAATRAFMEPRFGHDFSQVRVHTDVLAGESATAVGALAYTVGQDIVFGGQYTPGTQSGRQLLTHELVHTIQQSHAGAQSPQRLSVAPTSDPLEIEAERVSLQLTHDHNHERWVPGARIQTQAATRHHVNRQTPPGGGGGAAPARRIVYIDANVFDQINRGNQGAATALQQLRTSGAEVRISHWAFSEMVLRPDIPRTATVNRLMIQELGIRVDPAVPFARRIDIGIANQRPGGGTVLSPPDAQVAIAARVGGGEVWSFDRGFRNNPQGVQITFGIRVAPETHLPLVPPGSDADYRVGRRLLGLPPVEISLSGVVGRGVGA